MKLNSTVSVSDGAKMKHVGRCCSPTPALISAHLCYVLLMMWSLMQQSEEPSGGALLALPPAESHGEPSGDGRKAGSEDDGEGEGADAPTDEDTDLLGDDSEEGRAALKNYYYKLLKGLEEINAANETLRQEKAQLDELHQQQNGIFLCRSSACMEDLLQEHACCRHTLLKTVHSSMFF